VTYTDVAFATHAEGPCGVASPETTFSGSTATVGLALTVIGRLAVQNFKPRQLVELKNTQSLFRRASETADLEAMVLENNRFHEIMGEMFDAMGDLGPFFRRMETGGFFDLADRKGKAGGGFCTSFPTEGMPFVFANFNGTKGDVEVFSHEMGHAFQSYESRDLPLSDYLWPTYESAEIHSMSLEFLTWPHMERFFGTDADRFRRVHLAEALLFLPYGTAVDHFQHEIYARPKMSPAERHDRRTHEVPRIKAVLETMKVF